MTVSLVVGVTDRDWFGHLRAGAPWAEVNFWSPAPRTFRALTSGELFLFKLKAPVNRIVGGGIFTHAADLPSSLAWEAFGQGNGAASLAEMRARITRYRRDGSSGDFRIGARVLVEPTFWPEQMWLVPPASFSPQIVSFRRYATSDAEGVALWEAAAERMVATAVDPAEAAVRYGAPQLIRPRLGQGAFRTLVTSLYDRRCAVTEERTLPALDAAHIRPYGAGGAHEASNGLLLRRDVHSLFDAGYVTVTPQGRFEVSKRIREEFSNGRQYYALHGHVLRPPTTIAATPDPAALQWHNDAVFLG